MWTERYLPLTNELILAHVSEDEIRATAEGRTTPEQDREINQRLRLAMWLPASAPMQ